MLHEMAKSKIAGEYQFAGNAITLDPRLPPIERAGGRVSFTESSLAVHDVRGQLFGDQVRISGRHEARRRRRGGRRGPGDGRGHPPAVRPSLAPPAVRRARYTATVTVKEGRAQIDLRIAARGRVERAAGAAVEERGRDAAAAHRSVSGRRARPHLDRARAAGGTHRRGGIPARRAGRATAPGGTMQVQRSLVTSSIRRRGRDAADSGAPRHDAARHAAGARPRPLAAAARRGRRQRRGRQLRPQGRRARCARQAHARGDDAGRDRRRRLVGDA